MEQVLSGAMRLLRQPGAAPQHKPRRTRMEELLSDGGGNGVQQGAKATPMARSAFTPLAPSTVTISSVNKKCGAAITASTPSRVRFPSSALDGNIQPELRHAASGEERA